MLKPTHIDVHSSTKKYQTWDSAGDMHIARRDQESLNLADTPDYQLATPTLAAWYCIRGIQNFGFVANIQCASLSSDLFKNIIGSIKSKVVINCWNWVDDTEIGFVLPILLNHVSSNTCQRGWKISHFYHENKLHCGGHFLHALFPLFNAPSKRI